MSRLQKPNTLYKTPFSKAYWRDAAAELKDVRILVIAALLIAMRVALKSLAIPLAPNLKINLAAPFINALGAMIFGPVVAGLAACVSDTLGCILIPQGPYFFPMMFVEVAGSMVFALFFYRAKITPTRVILARFTMDLLVNICMNSAVMMWYYQFFYQKSYVAMILPAAIKNLCMFPIEAFLLTFFLSIMVPITYRLKLTYDGSKGDLKFNVKQFGLLLALFAVGVATLVGYLFYHYDTNSVSGSYTAEERYAINCQMEDYVDDLGVDYDQDAQLVTTVESAYKKFMKGYTTYNVAIYQVDDSALADYDKTLEEIRGLSKSKAAAVAEDGVMTRIATAVVVVDNDTGELLEGSFTPAE